MRAVSCHEGEQGRMEYHRESLAFGNGTSFLSRCEGGAQTSASGRENQMSVGVV
jgi:hypothetical protein